MAAIRKRTIAADSLRSNAFPLYERFSWLSVGRVACHNGQSDYSAYGSSMRLSHNPHTDSSLLRIEGLHVSYSTREGDIPAVSPARFAAARVPHSLLWPRPARSHVFERGLSVCLSLTPASHPSALKRLRGCQRVATVPYQLSQTWAAPGQQAYACGPARGVGSVRWAACPAASRAHQRLRGTSRGARARNGEPLAGGFA